MTQILKQDAPLYIDVTCYKCKRCVALSNAIERDGRYYCERCLHPTTDDLSLFCSCTIPNESERNG